MNQISIVIPVFRCGKSINELYLRLKDVLSDLSDEFELVFVNDASPDNSWELISAIARYDNKVKGISLSRNFGQHYAIMAGLDHCSGNWIVVMDCDLQDQPEEIIKLYSKANEGFDIVLGKRINRLDKPLKKFISKVFYIMLSFLTDEKHDYSIANFGIYRRKVIKTVLSMNDSVKYFPTMVHWVGYRSVSVDVVHASRKNSGSGYSFNKKLKLAIDVILSFTDKPLRLAVKLGLLITFSSLVFALYFLIQYLKGMVVVAGWTSLIISVWFLAGMIIFILGIVGLYVGKTFENVKQRPVYIITETLNIDEE